MSARSIMLLVAAIMLFAGACDQDGSVLTVDETTDTPTMIVGGGPSTPPNPGGGGPPEPTYCAPLEVDGLCECPPLSLCICEQDFEPCDMSCDDSCFMECPVGALYCNLSCGFGCQMLCPEGTLCTATCEDDCTLICLPGSTCDLTGLSGVSQIICEPDASCTCGMNCNCEGDGCDVIAPPMP
jgi:hypothetical protein